MLEFCSKCDTYVSEENIIEHEDKVYCDGCFDDKFSHCVICDTVCSIDSLREGEEGYICALCIEYGDA